LFSDDSYSRTAACFGYLTSNWKVWIYATHIKKYTPKFIPLLWEAK